jgi:flagellar L-ring protein precursor FlgH
MAELNIKSVVRGLWCLLFAVCFAGCSTVPESIVHQPSTPRPAAPAAQAPTNGAIFQAAAYRPMFEDRRARLAGDTLTIAISERTNAGKSEGNSNSRTGSVAYATPSLFGVSSAVTGRLGVASSSSNKFEEKEATTAGNTFNGTITCTVAEVLPNGHLLVSGEKQVAFDKGIEYVRFSGVVNPDSIAPGNLVSSTQVADARVEYRTNSRLDKAELMSQLARFFMSVLPM